MLRTITREEAVKSIIETGAKTLLGVATCNIWMSIPNGAVTIINTGLLVKSYFVKANPENN